MANRNKEILKKNRIVGYRKKKNLCLKCGKEKDHFGDCIENYNVVDNRVNKIEKIKVILQEPEKKKEITLLKNKEIKLQRSFIILDLTQSKYGDVIEFSCLNYISRKYKDFIICIFDDLEKHFSVSEMMKIRKLTNIFNPKYLPLQEKINYICSCKYLFSFPSQFTDYCKKYNISFYLFDENKNCTSILKNVPKLDI